MFDWFKDIPFFLSKRLSFEVLIIFCLNYHHINICVLLSYIKLINFDVTKTLQLIFANIVIYGIYLIIIMLQTALIKSFDKR